MRVGLQRTSRWRSGRTSPTSRRSVQSSVLFKERLMKFYTVLRCVAAPRKAEKRQHICMDILPQPAGCCFDPSLRRSGLALRHFGHLVPSVSVRTRGTCAGDATMPVGLRRSDIVWASRAFSGTPRPARAALRDPDPALSLSQSARHQRGPGGGNEHRRVVGCSFDPCASGGNGQKSS